MLQNITTKTTYRHFVGNNHSSSLVHRCDFVKIFQHYIFQYNVYYKHKIVPLIWQTSANQDQIKGKCAAYWRQADFWAKEKGYGPLNTIADQLHVKKSYKEEIICYKEEDILINGWCNTNGFNTGGLTGWGICSESCKFLKHKVDREQTYEDLNKVCTYFVPINFFNVVSISISLSSNQNSIFPLK